jgi:hypothetical protein
VLGRRELGRATEAKRRSRRGANSFTTPDAARRCRTGRGGTVRWQLLGGADQAVGFVTNGGSRTVDEEAQARCRGSIGILTKDGSWRVKDPACWHHDAQSGDSIARHGSGMMEPNMIVF